jgi:hypothetical protein
MIDLGSIAGLHAHHHEMRCHCATCNRWRTLDLRSLQFWQADEGVGAREKQSELERIGKRRNGSSSARFQFYALSSFVAVTSAWPHDTRPVEAAGQQTLSQPRQDMRSVLPPV